jgi:hypothetical protein
MDQSIRNKLRNVVTQCRKLLEEAVSQVLQGQFGISASGKKDEVHVEDESSLKLNAEDQDCRRDLVAHLGHIQALGYKAKDALAQLVREIAFTHLNRLCAYKMMEAREVWVGGQRFREAVSRGMKSQGFQFYLADHSDDKKLFDAGHQDVAYRHFLGWLGALLSEEIGVLFSPTDPANRLFPPQRVLDDVLALLNSDDLNDIWAEDETIGWVYQYFTPKELRDQVRKESAAPRNSYELAFRNQFFTPRYVVEFLTDNTLGRIWYEMRKGDTKLKDQCRYMVRRPSEVFLAEGQTPPEPTNNQEELSQDELLKQPVHIPHRSKKDPRELRILDPACGSGHFLLYCFALLLTIYEEAYADPDLGPKLKEDYPTLDAFRRDVPRLILAHNLHGIDIDLRASQIAALALWLRCQREYREMGLKEDRPRITKANIVCAEPMPGEKEMLDEFLKTLKQDRLEALIGRVMQVPEGSRVRATESMVESLNELVRLVWDKMQLAGEAGSLLKIEEELREAVRKGQEEWEEKQPLFRFTEFSLTDTPKESYVRYVPGEGVSFWQRAETLVLEALRDYARHAANGGRLQRLLFAEDAEHGFSFIDICQRRFDVVLMNPPFGDCSTPAKAVVEKHYPRTKNDVYAAFIESGLTRLIHGGMLGAITSRTGFFLSRFQKWREQILLKDAPPTTVADLGYGVLDMAMVETAAYCLGKDEQRYGTLFFRLLQARNKSETLHSTVSAVNAGEPSPDVYHVVPCSFTQVAGSPFAYWVSERVRRLFKEQPPFEQEGRSVPVGLQTSDDFRFLRCWWEVPASTLLDGAAGPNWRKGIQEFQDWCKSRTLHGKRWVAFAKGGEYAPYYADLHLVVDWGRDGEEMKGFARQLRMRQEAPSGLGPLRDFPFYFRPGLTWPRRTNSWFGIRVLPAGAMFADKGPAIMTTGQDEMVVILAFLFSQTYQMLIDIKMAAGDETQSGTASRSYEVGVIASLPWPQISPAIKARTKEAASLIIESARAKEHFDELAHTYVGFSPSRSTLYDLAVQRQRESEFAAVKAIEAAALIEQMVVATLLPDAPNALPIMDGNARVMTASEVNTTPADFAAKYQQTVHETIRAELDEQGGNRQVAVNSFYISRHLEVLAQTLKMHPRAIAQSASDLGLMPSEAMHLIVKDQLSFGVGVSLGRWDIRIATGERSALPSPDPFDPLPVCSPAMLVGSDGLPVGVEPPGYPIHIDRDGVVPDDPDHPDDIVRRVREVLELIWKDRAEAIEKEACEILGVKELRDYFRKPGKGGFWDDHVSRYSKSRRKAPIYWLLQSSKKNYALWLYYHRLDKDMLFKARQNYVEPKIRLEQSRLDSLRSQKTSLGTAAKGAKKIDKDIERQEALLVELKDFAEKLERAAKLNFGNPDKLNSDVVYDPDLNDGVVLTIAPLWELVPWKEAKNYWEELLEGKYEWSSMGKLLRKKGLVK